MPKPVPARFVSVDTAKSSQGHHNLIGVVVDCLPKVRTGGTSFAVTFTIKDTDYRKGNESWRGLKIKYFSNDESRLPDLRLNDVILLRRLRVSARSTVKRITRANLIEGSAVSRQLTGRGRKFRQCRVGCLPST